MNDIKHILKIETDKKVVLFSKNSIQQIMPLEYPKVRRNLNFEVIPNEGRFKYKSVIETADPPNLSIFTPNKVFFIYSIVRIKESGVSVPSIPFVSDSVLKYDGYIEFCPIFSMFLTNFKYKPPTNSWFFEFEET
ncbi:MAG: hypothetical protein LBU35_02440 [Holosporales bacterium]|jgi:hypothetical protein|nr:hypothetical protein [Holosporales bacterium]